MEENGVVKKNNVFAIVSLVLSLVGLIVAGLPCGIAAVVTGIIGLVKFDAETQKGKGMAIAGIIVGAVDIVLVVLFMIIKVAANI